MNLLFISLTWTVPILFLNESKCTFQLNIFSFLLIEDEFLLFVDAPPVSRLIDSTSSCVCQIHPPHNLRTLAIVLESRLDLDFLLQYTHTITQSHNHTHIHKRQFFDLLLFQSLFCTQYWYCVLSKNWLISKRIQFIHFIWIVWVDFTERNDHEIHCHSSWVCTNTRYDLFKNITNQSSIPTRQRHYHSFWGW
jgi:hypothetical protein